MSWWSRRISREHGLPHGKRLFTSTWSEDHFQWGTGGRYSSGLSTVKSFCLCVENRNLEAGVVPFSRAYTLTLPSFDG
jgi:hypothetical protein